MRKYPGRRPGEGEGRGEAINCGQCEGKPRRWPESEQGRRKEEGRKQAGCPKGSSRPREERRPHHAKSWRVLGRRDQLAALGLPSPTLPEARLKAGKEADDGRPAEELAGQGRQPARPRVHAGKGGSGRGCPGRRGWQSSPRHAQTVKAGQGEVGGGSLRFYLRCNSLVED